MRIVRTNRDFAGNKRESDSRWEGTSISGVRFYYTKTSFNATLTLNRSGAKAPVPDSSTYYEVQEWA